MNHGCNGKADEHGGKAHSQRKAARKLDIGPEQQKLATGDTEQRGDNPNDEAGYGVIKRN